MTGLEVPVFSPTSARAALSGGATRLEINRAGSYPEGGLTPAESEVGPLSGSPVPLRIMIRPRGRLPPPGNSDGCGGGDGGPDFVYSDAEFAEMRDAIRRFRACGCLQPGRGDGLVFGVLRVVRQLPGERPLLAVDADRNRELVRLAHPLACVFHRAFDDILGSSSGGGNSAIGGGGGGGAAAADPSVIEDALHAVAGCGFDGILTSGGPGSAADNIETLSRILRLAGRPGVGLEVIVGGGVRSSNVRALRGGLLGASALGASRVWLHSSCLTARSGGDDADEEEVDKIAGALRVTSA